MSYKIDFTTFSGNYSTNEQNTGFTWIDGKKIYKKSFSKSIASSNDVISGALASGATLVDAKMVLYSGQGYTIPGPYYSGPSDYLGISINSNGVDCTLHVGSYYVDTTTANVVATLYYTKSS